MCFETMQSLNNFMRKHHWHNSKVLKVQGIGKPLRPKYVARLSSISLFSKLRSWKKSVENVAALPPLGTICFPAVKVLT